MRFIILLSLCYVVANCCSSSNTIVDQLKKHIAVFEDTNRIRSIYWILLLVNRSLLWFIACNLFSVQSNAVNSHNTIGYFTSGGVWDPGRIIGAHQDRIQRKVKQFDPAFLLRIKLLLSFFVCFCRYQLPSLLGIKGASFWDGIMDWGVMLTCLPCALAQVMCIYSIIQL